MVQSGEQVPVLENFRGSTRRVSESQFTNQKLARALTSTPKAYIMLRDTELRGRTPRAQSRLNLYLFPRLEEVDSNVAFRH